MGTLPQFEADKSVSLSIAENFGLPECPVGLRVVAASWASVPKTAIHKHSQLFLCKKEIWFARNEYCIVCPAIDAIPNKCHAKL
jgi:hypothetical protein